MQDISIGGTDCAIMAPSTLVDLRWYNPERVPIRRQTVKAGGRGAVSNMKAIFPKASEHDRNSKRSSIGTLIGSGARSYRRRKQWRGMVRMTFKKTVRKSKNMQGTYDPAY